MLERHCETGQKRLALHCSHTLPPQQVKIGMRLGRVPVLKLLSQQLVASWLRDEIVMRTRKGRYQRGSQFELQPMQTNALQEIRCDERRIYTHWRGIVKHAC